MGFKSTKNRSSLRVVREFEVLGANYTVTAGREHLLYSAEVPADQFALALDLLADVISQPKFSSWEVRDEVANVAQLSEAVTSDARSMLYELLHQEAFRHQGLGNALYAPSYNLDNITPEVLNDFVSKNFTAKNIVVLGVGALGSNWINDVSSKFPQEGSKPSTRPSVYTGGQAIVPSGASTHFALGFEGASISSSDFFALGTLQALLGGAPRHSKNAFLGGQSSRLYSSLIEKTDWVEDVSAFNFNYSDSGIFGVAAVANRGKVAELVEKITGQLKQVKTSVSSDELQRAKNIFKASLLFSTEKKHSLAEFVGSRILSSQKISLPSEVAKGIASVTDKDVVNVAKKVFSSKPTLVALGDVYGIPSIEQIQKSLS